MSRDPDPAAKAKWSTERKKAKRQQQRENRDAKRKAAIQREARQGIPGEFFQGRMTCPYCAETFFYRLYPDGSLLGANMNFRAPQPPQKCPLCGHEITQAEAAHTAVSPQLRDLLSLNLR